MNRKPTINLAVDPKVLASFERTAAVYGHGKQKGLVLTAALLHFLEADPREQARCVEEAIRADLNAGTAKLLAEARRRQAYATAQRDASEGAGLKLVGGTPPTKPRRAAKKRGASRKSIKRLPSFEDLA
ncbi:MAG: hypothetical protein AAGE65_05470 [Planctomycetota bacterium]